MENPTSLAAFTGKKFRNVVHPEHAENQFQVVEFLPKFDFGNAGKWDAVRFERIGYEGQLTTRSVARFLKEHSEIVDSARVDS